MNESEFLYQVLKGEQNAVNLCITLGSISQTWDDLVDGDNHVPAEAINNMMWNALVAIPSNPFYRAHEPQLAPIVQMAISDWLDSNVLSEGSPHDKTLAYVLRDRLSSVVVQCALIIGGHAWMQQVGPEVRRNLQRETLTEYLAEPE